MTPNSTTNTYAGKFILVSGVSHGNEIFLGRAIDEPFGDQLSVEGKHITYGAGGYMAVRPFATMVNFPLNDPKVQIQIITNQEVRGELTNIFNSSINNLTRMTYPLTYRWIESAMQGTYHGNNGTWNHRWSGSTMGNVFQHSPFAAYYTGFQTSVEQFRRALFTSPQINTTNEMDKVTELEGNLAIGLGKVTNEAAIKFNHLVSRETELSNYFEWVQVHNMAYPNYNNMSGWFYLMQRIYVAKGWARRTGKSPLVREINTLFKESVKTLNDLILDHCSSLDTLIAETCSQYGISFELYGEMSPFTNYTHTPSGQFENYSYNWEPGTAPTMATAPVGV